MAENVNTTILQVDTGKAITSIKEYKQHIEDLKGKMLGLNSSSEEYAAVADEVRAEQEKLNEVLRDAKDGAEVVDGSYKQLTQTMAQLKKEWKSVDMGSDRWKELGQQIDSINDQLKDADASIGDYHRSVGDYANAFEEAFNRCLDGMSKVDSPLGKLAGQTKNLIPIVKKANDTATKGLKGVKKAIVSTGIGALVVAVGLLVSNWDKFRKIIGLSDEQMQKFKTGTMNVIKKIIGGFFGVGNVITQFLIAPIKRTIDAFKGLGQVAGHIFKGEFGQAVQAAKSALSDMWADTTKAFDFKSNYEAGVQMAENVIDGIKDRLKDGEKEVKDAESKVTGSKTSSTTKTDDSARKEAENIAKRAREAQKTELQILDETFAIEKKKLQDQNIATTDLEKEYAKKRAKIVADEVKKTYDTELASINGTNDKNAVNLKYAGMGAEKGGLSLEEKIAQTNELFDIDKRVLEQRKALYDQMTGDEQLSEEQRLEAQENATQTQIELENLITQNKIDNVSARIAMDEQEKEEVRKKIERYQAYGEAMSNVMSSVADLYESTLESQVSTGKLSEEQAKKQFGFVKGLRIGEATINTINGAIGAFMQASSTYPAPYGQIIGGIQAAAVTAAGLAQIQQIRNTQFGGSSSGNAGGSMNPGAVPVKSDYNPEYVTSVTGMKDTMNLGNALADGMGSLKVYVLESEITDAQNTAKARVEESTF